MGCLNSMGRNQVEEVISPAGERRKRMGMTKRIRGLGVLAVAAVVALTMFRAAHAQEVRHVTTEYGGSVVVYPKVIWDGTRDTIIQIGNTGNTVVYAHCFYINAAPLNPSLPISPTNPAQWIE